MSLSLAGIPSISVTIALALKLSTSIFSTVASSALTVNVLNSESIVLLVTVCA